MKQKAKPERRLNSRTLNSLNAARVMCKQPEIHRDVARNCTLCVRSIAGKL